MILLVPIFLCWGSFLNVVAYRLVNENNIYPLRSFCPHCKKTIAWYDNIPLVSWLLLQGRCRYCKNFISWLYPFIELFTTISLSALYLTFPNQYFFPYFIFFSAMIITIRTDLEKMLISRFVTIFLIPVGFAFSWVDLLPISLKSSLLGTCLGYGFLFAASKIFYLFTKREGIGQGDLELLGFIGAFLGVAGCWISLFIGSILGSIIGLIYLKITNDNKYIKIPFGPFLALGAISFVLFSNTLQSMILGG